MYKNKIHVKFFEKLGIKKKKMWIMWITWCISPLFPRKPENENVDNFHRTDVLKRVSMGENGKKLCILSKEGAVRGKG